MKRIFSCMILCIACLMTGYAQFNNSRSYVILTFTPDHEDWNYNTGDSVIITVGARVDNHYVRDLNIRYEWGYEQYNALRIDSVITGSDGLAVIRLKAEERPGFMTCKATAHVGDKDYTNYINVALSRDSILPTTTMPEDFESYWRTALDKARKVPLEPVLTLIPEQSNGRVDVYHIRYQNDKVGSYFYGILSVPKGVEGKIPAVVLYPGAGIRPYSGGEDSFTKNGIARLDIGIHGIPVNLPKEVYANLTAGAMSGYPTHGLEDKDNYYYRRVYLGAVKAVDFLQSLDFIDPDRVAVFGGSQGGLLSTVVAALHEHIVCASIAYPALSEMAGSLSNRAEGWPRIFRWKKGTNTENIRNTVRYYDCVNFGQLITIPVLFFQGYNDHVCMPTTTFSVYNMMTCPKQLVTPLECGHWLFPDQYEYRTNWLIEHLKTAPLQQESADSNKHKAKGKNK